MNYNERIYKIAYNEAVSDLMMELHICESQAKNKLNEMLSNDPTKLDHLYKQFYTIRMEIGI